MNDVEYILNFVANIGGRLLYSGANLERVNDTMNRICLSYHLESVSIFSLSSTIIVSARSAEGTYGSCQISVPPASIHLEKLNRLNRLSRRVCTETPKPELLAGLLEESGQVKEYPVWMVILGYLTAMTIQKHIGENRDTSIYCVFRILQG